MDSDFARDASKSAYAIDWDRRLILTQYHDEPEIVVDFNSAFAKAIECIISLEDGKWPNGSENLYLAVYQRYVTRGMVSAESFHTPAWARFNY